jgi:integrase
MAAALVLRKCKPGGDSQLSGPRTRRRRANIDRALAEVRGNVVRSTSKTLERRSVTFPTCLADERAALMVGTNRDDLVFTGPEGGVLRTSLWRPRVFTPAVKHLAEVRRKRQQDAVVEFPLVTPHDLRHPAASLAIGSGDNGKAVQTMLDHASAVLTLGTFADLFPRDPETVSAALDLARRDALEQARDAT